MNDEERYAQTILDFRNEHQSDFAALVEKYTSTPGLVSEQYRRKNTVRAKLVEQQDDIKAAFISGKTSCEVAFDYHVHPEYIINFVKEVFGKEFYYKHVYYGGRVK